MGKSHSLLPWIKVKAFNGGYSFKSAESGKNEAWIADTIRDEVYISEEDVDLILRAVNEYDDIIDILIEALLVVEGAFDDEVYSREGQAGLRSLARRFRMAIAKAEGK